MRDSKALQHPESRRKLCLDRGRGISCCALFEALRKRIRRLERNHERTGREPTDRQKKLAEDTERIARDKENFSEWIQESSKLK